jgi:hypothetical protein
LRKRATVLFSQVLLDADPTDKFGDRAELFAGKKTVLFVRFHAKIIILPRRAWDKHSENSKKEYRFLAAMETARSTGLDWETWYTQRKCEVPPAANVTHCATHQNASTCRADETCQPDTDGPNFLACKATDTNCFPCRDAESKECPQAVEEYLLRPT